MKFTKHWGPLSPCPQLCGLDIKLVKDLDLVTSYMTKQIDYPQLNIDRTKVIDVVNSDIGQNHYSVKGERRDDWIYQYKRQH